MILNKLKKAVSVFKQFWGILTKKYRIYFILIFFAIFIASLLETLGISVLLPFIQAVLNPEQLMQNKYIISITRFFNITEKNQFIIFITTFVVLFYVLKNTYQFWCNYIKNKYRTSLHGFISETIMESYLHRPYDFFIKTNSSILVRNVISDSNSITLCVGCMFSILTTLLIIIFMSVFLFITDPILASGLCLSAIVVLIGPVLLLGKKLRNEGADIRTADAECYKYSMPGFNGIKEIIVSHKEDYFSDAYHKAFKNKARHDLKKCVIEIIPSRLIEVVCLSALIIIVTVNVITGRVVSEVMVAKLGAFAIAAFKLLPSVSSLSTDLNQFIVQAAALNSVYEILNDNDKYINNDGNKEIKFTKNIKFNNLSFFYEGNKDKLILNKVSTEIIKGDVVGIKGPSGSGKTTFVDLLLGLLNPTEGNITIDNNELNHENILSWRRNISYVPQSAYLTDDSIRANIAFGIPESEIDNVKIQKAIKESMLDEYVNSLPNKEYTIVGERGVQMSGGQRQRLSIARALYTNPSIIIFDEATSALDETTEKEIMESIDNLIGQKTLIIIAHRLSTLKKCNIILEVKDGDVIVSHK